MKGKIKEIISIILIILVIVIIGIVIRNLINISNDREKKYLQKKNIVILKIYQHMINQLFQKVLQK